MKRILLTADDGYNSIGVRLLIHFLKDTYDLSIAGTKTQQSGMGGKKTLTETITWGKDTIDGVPAFWVSGTPIDAVEGAREYYNAPFDLVISGMNLGINTGGCLISSGTFSAAFYAVNMGLANQSIAISWDVSEKLDLFFRDHDHLESLAPYIDHPGETMAKLVRHAITHNLWDTTICNINVAAEKNNVTCFTKPLESMYNYWGTPTLAEDGTFSYKRQNYPKDQKDKETDAYAIGRGENSISLCQSTMLDKSLYAHVAKKTFSL